MFVRRSLNTLFDEHVWNSVLDCITTTAARTDKLITIDADGLLVERADEDRKQLRTDRSLRRTHGQTSASVAGDPAAIAAIGLAAVGDPTPSLDNSSRARSATKVPGPATITRSKTAIASAVRGGTQFAYSWPSENNACSEPGQAPSTFLNCSSASGRLPPFAKTRAKASREPQFSGSISSDCSYNGMASSTLPVFPR